MKKPKKKRGDKPSVNPGSASPAAEAAPAVDQLVYESNPRHRDPWQPGKKGGLCPREIDIKTAQRLLNGSYPSGKQRYAVYEGQPYAAKEHRPGLWHGHPAYWVDVPPEVWSHFKECGLVRNRDMGRYWKP